MSVYETKKNVTKHIHIFFSNYRVVKTQNNYASLFKFILSQNINNVNLTRYQVIV